SGAPAAGWFRPPHCARARGGHGVARYARDTGPDGQDRHGRGRDDRRGGQGGLGPRAVRQGLRPWGNLGGPFGVSRRTGPGSSRHRRGRIAPARRKNRGWLMSEISVGLGVAVAFLLILVFNSIKILPEYERGVVFRLGRLRPFEYGPGIFLLIPVADRMIRVPLRTVVHDVPTQDVITRDNVSVKVNAVVYFRVINPRKAIVEVENYHYATSQLSQTMLRSVLGQHELDELLSQRERLNAKLQEDLDRDTDPWGIKVSKVEVKHVDLPETMQRAMAKQAEAEREKRAKIIHAEGELQASEKLAQAADIIGRNPVTLQLRYLQTLTEIASEKNSTILFPVPIELLRSLGSSREGR